MIKGVKYSNKKVSECSVKGINLSRDLVWLDVSSKNQEDFKPIEKKFGLYSRDFVDSIDINEVPRLSTRKDYLFIVLRVLNEKNKSTPIGVFLSKRFIITVHAKDIKPLSKFFKVLTTKEGKEFFNAGTDFLFYKIISELNRNLHKDLDDFEDKLDDTENKILKNKFENVHELFPLKRKLTYYKKALNMNREILGKLITSKTKFVSEKNDPHLNALAIELNQVESTLDFQRERLTGISEMHMSSVSNKLNDIMKSFTVLASILLLPTLISGIWGMNFEHIPFFNLEYGFYMPILLMVISVIGLYIFFKAKKWL